MKDLSRPPRSSGFPLLPVLLVGIGLLCLLALGGMFAALAAIWWYFPRPAEGKMEFSLPASGEARARAESGVGINKPGDQELALRAEVTVTLKAARGAGEQRKLGELWIRSPRGESKARNVEELAERLKTLRPTLANQDDIQIEAESTLSYDFVIDAMDACVKAGFTNVGFSPPPDLDK